MSAVPNFESARTTIRPAGLINRTVARNRAQPRTSADFPFRIRTATGRAIGVEAIAINGCRVFFP